MHGVKLGSRHHVETRSLGTERQTTSACVQVDGDWSPAES